jgi:hypothetical protein
MTRPTSSKGNFRSYSILAGQGLCLFLIYLYYKSVYNESEIDNTEVVIYDLFCAILLTISFGLCFWTFKQKSFRYFKIFSVVIVLIQFVFLMYFHLKLIPLPSEFRLTLVNKTKSELTNLKLTGCEDINIDKLEKGEKREIIIPLFEGCSIDLINNSDTVTIGHGSTNNFGYKKEYSIQLSRGN